MPRKNQNHEEHISKSKVEEALNRVKEELFMTCPECFIKQQRSREGMICMQPMCKRYYKNN